MKRISLLLVVAMLLSFLATCINAKTIIHEIALETTTPSINGVIGSSEWSDAAIINVDADKLIYYYTNIGSMSNGCWDVTQGAADGYQLLNDSTLYAKANKNGVYFAFDINDISLGTSFVKTTGNGAKYYSNGGEGVSVTFKPNQNGVRKGGEGVVRISFSPFVNQGYSTARTINMKVYEDFAYNGDYTTTTTDITSAVNTACTADSNGYVIEAFIKWDVLESLGFDVPEYKAGNEINVNFSIHDAHNKRNSSPTPGSYWGVFEVPINATYSLAYDNGTNDGFIINDWQNPMNFIAYEANTGDVIKFKGENKTITFNTNNGTAVSSISVKTGEKIDLSKYVTSKKGMQFLGWCTDKDLTNVVSSITIDENTTLYAKFAYKVNFNYRNYQETNSSYTIYATENEFINLNQYKCNEEGFLFKNTLLETFSNKRRTNSFIGWYLDEQLTTPADFINVSGETNLYAKYAVDIDFETMGSIIDGITVEQGTVVNLESLIPQKSGLEFEGWYTEPHLVNKVTSIVANKNCKLYAKYKAKINFLVKNAVSETLFVDQYTVIDLTEKKVDRTGLDFAGWYSDSSYENKINFVLADKGKDVFAKYNANITFMIGNKKVNQVAIAENSYVELEQYGYNEAGYKFEGWYLDSKLVTKVNSITVSKNITLYGKQTLLDATGLYKENNDYYFTNEYGNNVKDCEITINDTNSNGLKENGKYYFDSDGKMIVSEFVGNNFYSETGARVGSYYGIAKTNSGFYYIYNGKIAKNEIITVKETKSNGTGIVGKRYFNEDGLMATNELIDDVFYLDDGSIARPYTGLVKDKNGDYYYIDDSIVKNYEKTIKSSKINGLNKEPGKYYFGSDGKMLINEVANDYFYGNDGIRVRAYTGLVRDNAGYYYYIYSEGKIVKDYLSCFSGKKLAKFNGLITIDGWYYFGCDGKMVIQDVHDGYFFNESGTRVPAYYGLVKASTGYYYYIDENKQIVRNAYKTVKATKNHTSLPNGKYLFDEDGRLVEYVSVNISCVVDDVSNIVESNLINGSSSISLDKVPYGSKIAISDDLKSLTITCPKGYSINGESVVEINASTGTFKNSYSNNIIQNYIIKGWEAPTSIIGNTTIKVNFEKEEEINNIIYQVSLPSDGEISNYVSAISATVSSETKFSSEGRVAKIIPTTSGTLATVSYNLLNCASAIDSNMKFGKYLVVKYRTYGVSSATLSAKSLTTTAGRSITLSSSKSLTCTSTWQYAMFDMSGITFPTDGFAKKLTLTLNATTTSTSGCVYISQISLTNSMYEAYSACEMGEFAMLEPTETIVDPLENVGLTASNENSNVKLWFDQSTEKKIQSDTKSSGKKGFTVYMSKNEVESTQLFISPNSTMNIRVSVDTFKDKNGNVLESKLYYEYYHNIQNVLRPDAVIPYSDPITVNGGQSQAFLIKLISNKNTVPGDYYSIVHVYDNDTGLEIKRAKVGAHVWNVTLSDETEMRTLFGLWGDMLYSSYNHNTCPYTWDELYESAYDFLLDYRINASSMVNGVSEGTMTSTLMDPRVNSVRSDSDTLLTVLGNERPEWLSKVVYYPTDADEPRTNAHFTIIKNRCTTIKNNNKDAKIVLPFERNLDLTSSGTITDFSSAQYDSISYMSQYLNVWCPKTTFFTERKLSFINGTEYLISQSQENKYGSFIDRMNAEVAGGDELWAYVALNPTEPYCNFLIKSDGTDAITLMWQMKHYNVTGFLYWAVDYYRVNYWSTSSSWSDTNNGAYGDGILFYPGYKLYQKEPIATIRLEQLRDGIEDYQMLCMLEEVAGKEVCDNFIKYVTSSVVIHTTDDDYLRNVRALLGKTLEEYLG